MFLTGCENLLWTAGTQKGLVGMQTAFFFYLRRLPIWRSREFEGLQDDACSRHTFFFIYKWESTWKFNLPFLFVQVCVSAYSSGSFRRACWIIQIYIFLSPVAMAVWNGCSVSLLGAHALTQSTDGACWQMMNTHKHRNERLRPKTFASLFSTILLLLLWNTHPRSPARCERLTGVKHTMGRQGNN